MNAHIDHAAIAAQLPPQFVSFLRGELRELSDAECDLFYAVGASLYRDENYSDAASIFRALVLGRPNGARGWSCLAMCHDAVEDYERAAALYEIATQAPRTEGYEHRARLYFARTLFWLERFEEAEAQLDRITGELDDELASVRDELRGELDRTSRRGS